MPISADKPHLWKADTQASVDQFNQWFVKALLRINPLQLVAGGGWDGI